jgi:hypothetical protein
VDWPGDYLPMITKTSVILRTFCINNLFDGSHRKEIIAISKFARSARKLSKIRKK